MDATLWYHLFENSLRLSHGMIPSFIFGIPWTADPNVTSVVTLFESETGMNKICSRTICKFSQSLPVSG